MECKTTLYDTHVKYGGKMVPFAGFLLPVQYGTGVIAEHMAVRTACGLFDVSHMGEILCEGEAALDNLNHLLTNDFTSMVDGQARYSPMCNEEGGVVDDLIVYKIRDNHYFIVVNASNKDKDFAWMMAHKLPGAELKDISAASGAEGGRDSAKTDRQREPAGKILHLPCRPSGGGNPLHRIEDRLYRGRRIRALHGCREGAGAF